MKTFAVRTTRLRSRRTCFRSSNRSLENQISEGKATSTVTCSEHPWIVLAGATNVLMAEQIRKYLSPRIAYAA